MPTTQTLKVTANKIVVHRDGDHLDKGEVEYQVQADGEMIVHGNRKTGSGETIHLNESTTVTKGADADLTILGNITERDGGGKGADDTVSIRRVFTQANRFGIGNHAVRVNDGRQLDVTFYFTVAAV